MKEQTLYCVMAELQFARHRFPSNKLMLAALVEEIGELANALIEHSRGKREAKDVYAEAIQCIVMAIRIAEEGSNEFAYKFEHAHYQAFNVNKLLPRRKQIGHATNCVTINCQGCGNDWFSEDFSGAS